MSVPSRIEAAMEFLSHANELRHPTLDWDESKKEARELTPHEQRVETEALNVLFRYFVGEDTYGEDKSIPPKNGDDDDDDWNEYTLVTAEK